MSTFYNQPLSYSMSNQYQLIMLYPWIRISIHLITMPLSQPTISCSFLVKDLFIQVHLSQLNTPSHSCIFIPFMPSYNNPINSMPNIQEQERKHQTRTHSHPALRSGWRVSLRRAPLRLGESSTRRTVAPAQSRLGETPFA